MSDSFGLLEIPVDETALPIGDPALTKLGGYLQAVLNGYVGTAWATLRPRPGDEALPVKSVLFFDPRGPIGQRGFSDALLPALFIYRDKEPHGREADDWFAATAEIHVWWIYPSDKRDQQLRRLPFANAVGKVISNAIERRIDPLWVDAGDTTAGAASVAADADSFVLAHATSTSAQTLSGAQLDGVRGGNVQSPRLGLTVTVAAATDSEAGDDDPGGGPPIGGPYPLGAPIVVTFVDAFGVTVTESLYFTSESAAQTLTTTQDIAQLISVAEPAMLGTNGSLQYGNAARTGRGSLLLERSGFSALHVKQWTPIQLEAAIEDGESRKVDTLRYDAVLVTLDAREVEMLGTTDAVPNAVHFDVNQDDSFTTSETLPHD